MCNSGIFSCSFVYRTASQSLTQAIKFLASKIEKTDSDILAAEDRLSELSLQAIFFSSSTENYLR
jgi:hypothetical protein